MMKSINRKLHDLTAIIVRIPLHQLLGFHLLMMLASVTILHNNR